jgi:hypothetical protein
MPQDLPQPPGAAALAETATGPLADRIREYYTDAPCAEGQGCGGEGIVLPFERGNNALDDLFGFTDVETLPFSDEVLPVIFDGALLTEEGLLDCFARHYPERAGFLLQLLSDEGDLALGYRLEFTDDAPESTMAGQALAAARERYQEVAARQQQLRGSVRSQLMGAPQDGGMGSRNAEGMALEGEAITLRNTIRDLEQQMSQLMSRMGRWDIDDNARVIRADTTINTNVQRAPLVEYVPGADNGINPLPTNKEGADWLNAVMGDWMARNGYPGAGSEEEFFRNWLTRTAAGTVLVGLGAVEMFGGVMITVGSSGLGAVAGVALTVVGYDTLTQGAEMLWTPDRHTSERGWIGDLVHDTAMYFGGEEAAQAFDRGWAVTQILVGLGAPVVIRYAATRATRVVGSGWNITPIPRGQLDEARLGIVEVRGHRFGRDFVGDYSPLPSGRGAILNANGVGRFRLPQLDSEMRVLLRMKRMGRAQLQARFARLTRHQGPAILRDRASAQQLLEKVADHCGVNLARFVDDVRYGPSVNGELASFQVIGGQRIITISNLLPQTNKYMQLKVAAHELNHARIYDKFLTRMGRERGHLEYWAAHRDFGTRLYAREEVIVEQAAQIMIRSVFEGKLTGANLRRLTEAIDDSRSYIADWRRVM